MSNCRRCTVVTNTLKMSWFNTEMLCKACQDEESKHPDLQKAKDAENAAIKCGNYNFKGIGKPSDL